MFTVGTGVGGGMVFNGRLYRGATSAGELGHTVIGLDLEDGAPTPEGKHPLPGTLEYLAAGRALDRLAEREAREEEGSFLGKRLEKDGEVTGVDVVEGAKAGDADALRVLDVLGQRLGIGIANAINLFDPEEIVIGGGVSIAGDLLLDPARAGRARSTPCPGSAATPRSGSPATARRPACSARRWSPRHEEEAERSPMATARELRSGLPPDRRARPRRRSAHDRARRHQRDDRLVLLPVLRLAERVRRRSSTRTRAASTRCARPPRSGTSKQLYFPDTNVLITRFFTEDGVGEVQDFMPIDHAELAMHRHRLIRRVVVVRGPDGASRSRCSRASTTAAPSTRSRCTRTGCCSARPT